MGLFDLRTKIAAITGSTKGVGLGIARETAALGAKVIVSSRTQADCERVAGELNREFGNGSKIAHGLVCDLGDWDSVCAFTEQAPQIFGGIDILVCNASILPIYTGPSAQTPPEMFNRLLTGIIHHNFQLCERLRPSIAARGGGSIVLIGSTSGLMGVPSRLAYSVAKAGLVHLSLNLAQEMAPDKIRVNCVCPGLTRSYSALKATPEDEMRVLAHEMPLQRVGEPEDIAGAVIYLSSAAGQHVTGETIVVDGGRTHLVGSSAWTGNVPDEE